MYDYKVRTPAPRIVEFFCRTHQGHRVVRIYLFDPKNPRVMAFNESSCERSPAMLFMSELETLLQRAQNILENNNEQVQD